MLLKIAITKIRINEVWLFKRHKKKFSRKLFPKHCILSFKLVASYEAQGSQSVKAFQTTVGDTGAEWCA